MICVISLIDDLRSSNSCLHYGMRYIDKISVSVFDSNRYT